jgi:hypothetical protein
MVHAECRLHLLLYTWLCVVGMLTSAPVSCVWKLTRYKNGTHMNNKLNNLITKDKYMSIPHSNKNTHPP